MNTTFIVWMLRNVAAFNQLIERAIKIHTWVINHRKDLCSEKSLKWNVVYR